MTRLRSERLAAILLLVAAALGLALANSPVGPALLDVQHAHLGPLSVGHWISDGLLAVFFFVVAIELKHEFAAGQLNSMKKAARPAIAALGGVIVPALIYLAFTAGSGVENGWPIPTATDIAFALGILALFGRGLPSRIRVFILALAIIDDLVAILIIAVLFTDAVDLLSLAVAAVAVALFGVLSRLKRNPLVAVVMVALAGAAWWFTHESGVHATIAGVALGLAMAREPAAPTRHAIEPWTNAVILPLFAFSAALVVIPNVPVSELSPAFAGILVALPVGKLVGVGIATWAVSRGSLTTKEIVTIGALAGIGFTVSLLMNELALSGTVQDEGTLAVLLGSAIAIVFAAVMVSILRRSAAR